MNDITFAALWDEYLRATSLRIRPRTIERYENAAMHLLPFFGDKTLELITPKYIDDYMIFKTSKGVKPATINRELSSLRAALNKAIKWEWLVKNPFDRVDFLKEPPGRIRYLTQEEYNHLLSFCPTWLEEIVVFAVGTGMRLGEITALKWDNISFNNRTITIDYSKNGERRTIPMSQTVMSLLQSIPRHIYSKIVFCRPNGLTRHSVSKKFAKTIKQAKIEDFRFHDLRHTCASWLVLNGVDINTVREILGHKTIEMTLRYAHLANEAKAKAIDKLDKMLSGKRQLNIFEKNFDS